MTIYKVRKDPQAPFNINLPDNIAAFMVQNVQVLAVGQQSDQPASTPTNTGDTTATQNQQSQQKANRGLVTLAVDPQDAQRLAFAQQNYAIYLTLVPPSYTPENLPSVINATSWPSPLPTMAAVGLSISRIPGPPFGPS